MAEIKKHGEGSTVIHMGRKLLQRLKVDVYTDKMFISTVPCEYVQCIITFIFVFFFIFLLFFFPRAAPVACGSSQTRGQIGAGAAAMGLYHSHSNARSELGLQPTPQLTETPDP